MSIGDGERITTHAITSTKTDSPAPPADPRHRSHPGARDPAEAGDLQCLGHHRQFLKVCDLICRRSSRASSTDPPNFPGTAMLGCHPLVWRLSMPASVGWRGFGGDGISTTTTDVTKLGTLVVDIFDGQKQKLIWRGKKSDALSGN